MKERRHRTGQGRAGLVLLLAGLLGGCSEGAPPKPPPQVELGFTQILPEEGTDRALVRVINQEAKPITVTAVGMEWPGYGDVLEHTDSVKVVPAESELMLRLGLPEPGCTDDGQPPPGEVKGRVTVDGVQLNQPLTEPAQTYVRRLWRTQCDAELLAASWRVTLATAHRPLARAAGDGVEVSLVLRRVGNPVPTRVVSVDGSVLYDLALLGDPRIGAAAGNGHVRLAILPGNRCDEHAIGQATAPYDFSATLQIGDRKVHLPLRPPPVVRNAASAMLSRHCGAARR